MEKVRFFIIIRERISINFILAPDVEMDTGPNAATEMLIDEGPDTPDEPRDPIDDLTSRINNKYVLLYYCIIYIFKFIAPVYKIEVQ